MSTRVQIGLYPHAFCYAELGYAGELSAFPRIGSDTTDPAERGFIDAMTWLGGLFSQGVREVRIER